MTAITEPGLVHDLPHDDYLADPVPGGSLSSSGMKTLVKQTPAHYAYEREHGRPAKDVFELGHVVHKQLLGAGPEVVVVDAEAWTRKADQQTRKDARAEGKAVVLRREWDEATEMVAAVRRHPIAGPLLTEGTGEAEVSAFAPDPLTGVWLRARFDWLRRPAKPGGRHVIVDVKTAASAHPDKFRKAAHDYGYDIQDATYTHVAKTLGLGDVAFLFVVVEITPPYLVNVIQLNHTGKQIGAIDMRQAIGTYAECSRTGHWPGYGEQVNILELPGWVERQYEGLIAS